MAKKHEPIPKDFVVRPLTKHQMGKICSHCNRAHDRGDGKCERHGKKIGDVVTCGHCGLSWDDSIPTEWTPTPSARCPFEYFHIDDEG